MVKSKLKCCKGFTLIEVLIALAILSIAMTAIIRATSQSLQQTGYIENKNLSGWVGINTVNEIIAGLVKVPNFPDELKEEVTILNKKFVFAACEKSTPNAHIQEINVDVFMHDKNMGHWVGYVSE